MVLHFFFFLRKDKFKTQNFCNQKKKKKPKLLRKERISTKEKKRKTEERISTKEKVIKKKTKQNKNRYDNIEEDQKNK